MINPIEGPPVNDLQSNLPEFKTTFVSNRTPVEPRDKQAGVQKGIENFNNFVNNISQDKQGSKQTRKPVDLDKIAKRLQEIIADENLMIEFTRDDETKKLIFKLINSETKEIIRQIPPDVALKIARYVASTLEDKNVANAKV